jgi:NAD(P)H-hydrate epimerase
MAAKIEILTSDELKKAEAAPIPAAVTRIEMMTAAGIAVAEEIIGKFKPCPVLVLCGPGNNGGDGFITAQRLKKAGWTVRLACMAKRNALKNDAAVAAQKWDGEIEGLNSNLSVHQTSLVVDAIFGTGFSGAIAPELATLFEKIKTRKIPVIAVDVPTGLNASTGEADPATPGAEITVTFCRKKYGHILYPGRKFCGKTVVAGIGITDAAVTALNTSGFENHPALWLRNFPIPDHESHKYTRGHVVVYGGGKRTGAACLAAAAAQRAGAGLVTIAGPSASLPIYAGYRASIMTDECNGLEEFKNILRDERKNAVVIGPGAGVNDATKQAVEAALSFNKTAVLDADVFSVFKDGPKDLFTKLSPRHVLTPHEGEFEKLFGTLEGNRAERALKAAATANAIVVLKGADTVIAAPDGALIINTNAPPTLATAGAGDVLAGLIAGLSAQNMPPFMAAAAAVWLHGKAARLHGLGLTAEDIIFQISQALNRLFKLPREES